MGSSIVLLIFIVFVFDNERYEGSGKPQPPDRFKLAVAKKETVLFSLGFSALPCSFVSLFRELVGFKKKKVTYLAQVILSE